LFQAETEGVKKYKKVETIICPPFCYLPMFSGAKKIKLGGQNLFWELQGAYTGEISGKMLKGLGCDYVILGHSERRHFLGETDEIINLKIKAAIKSGLMAIFCVGENAGEEIGEIITKQINEGLKDISKAQIKNVIIAYEPVWAIGSGNPCLPENAFGANLLIKKILTSLYSRFIADNTRIIYGGSVDAKNAAWYIKESQMNGCLVGGASLEAEEFIKIVAAVNNV